MPDGPKFGVYGDAQGIGYDFYAINTDGSTAYGTASSIRQKTNITRISNPLDTLVADHFHFQPGFQVQAGATLVTLFADYDGMDNAWKIEHFGDLNVAVAGEDLDGDILTNFQESQYQTNPHCSDTDGDLMSDAWEVASSMNPIVNDAAGDLG